MRWECSREQGGRSVERSPYCEVLLSQEEKQQEEGKRELLRLRMRTVEPVFAVIKERLGFRRYTVGGLEKVRAQWSFVCALVNLLRLYPLWRKGVLQLS